MKKALLLGGMIISVLVLAGCTITDNQTSTTNEKKEIATPANESTKLEAEAPAQTETSQPEQNKAMRILQEQKEKAEETTRTAVSFVTENKTPKTVDLYNDRWNEIAQVRLDIMYDKELTDEEKKNIDQALEKEQEGITDILSKYQELY